jgi:hypothetical protein
MRTSIDRGYEIVRRKGEVVEMKGEENKGREECGCCEW